MEYKNFYNKFESLPAEAKKQVIMFMDFLQNKYESKIKKNREKKSILSDKKFIGIWENRDDLKNSIKWKKNIRKKEWKGIEK